MGKILKDPFEKYGEAKGPPKRSSYGGVEVAPDYASVKKALLVRRLMWMIPSGIGFGLFLLLLSSFGLNFLFGFLWVVLGVLGLGAIIAGGIWCLETGEKTGKVLKSAKERGVRDV